MFVTRNKLYSILSGSVPEQRTIKNFKNQGDLDDDCNVQHLASSRTKSRAFHLEEGLDFWGGSIDNKDASAKFQVTLVTYRLRRPPSGKRGKGETAAKGAACR
ncbi:hypothetical protein CEXT_409521 [Caerostris extrusa]|uniref:Uncharacterized protein n=1 Tax=Caerostris extrusa TaxID=172846 RepID=A0AAV4TPK7_CAEEX|nr:hypothetical protein CEXT_409521 [Caerostris extrusa]